jgi:hypothetical protein
MILKKNRNLIKESFTTLLDLTEYAALDDRVSFKMEEVQEFFKNIGWGSYARVKRQDTHLRLSKDMIDGFFTSTQNASVYLNLWRIENGVN